MSDGEVPRAIHAAIVDLVAAHGAFVRSPDGSATEQAAHAARDEAMRELDTLILSALREAYEQGRKEAHADWFRSAVFYAAPKKEG